MRCLVTGASGFVGAWLIKKLVREGTEVAALARPTSDLWRIREVLPQVKIIHGDISKITEAGTGIVRFAPDVICHLAWGGANSRKYVNDAGQAFDNVPGSLELVRFAHEAGTRCFVMMGTALEYGRYKVPVSEADPVQPTTLYGRAKYAVSLLVESLCQGFGIRFCGLRLFWTYGPLDDEARMIPYLTRRLLNGERPSLTPGHQIWDYLYIQDAVEAIYRVATTEGVEGVFNLGSGEPHTIRNVAERIRDIISPALPLGFGEIPYGPDQVMHLQADIRKLQAATGWRPTTDLDAGLRRTVEWHRSRAGI